MFEKRFKISERGCYYTGLIVDNGNKIGNNDVVDLLNEQHEAIIDLTTQKEDLQNELYYEKEKFEKLLSENEQLKRFENTGEHIRLSINIETNELQRHIYATGQWFGDFDRVLCKNQISEEDYQKFIDRIIEVYNSEFKRNDLDE